MRSFVEAFGSKAAMSGTLIGASITCLMLGQPIMALWFAIFGMAGTMAALESGSAKEER